MVDKRKTFDVDAARALLALAATERPPAGQCPSTEEIAAWQARALDAADAGRLDAHVPHCQRCLELWTGMLEATGALEPPPAPTRQPQSSRFSGRWRGAAVAASAVVVFAVAGVLLHNPAGQAPLTPYTLQIDDRMRQRGADVSNDTAVHFGDGDAFVLTARPETAVGEPVHIRMFVDAGAGPVPLDAPSVRAATSGALQVTGTVGRDIKLPAGTSVLYVIVGRKDELPTVEVLVNFLADQSRAAERDWTAWRLPMVVYPAALP